MTASSNASPSATIRGHQADVVNFEGVGIEELENAFHEAVDDWLGQAGVQTALNAVNRE